LTALIGLPGLTMASGVAYYQLVNTSAKGTTPVDQVVASILPAGSVPDGTNPNGPTSNPFAVLAGSSGFNVANLVNFLGSGTLDTGDLVEVIKAQFDSQGFAPGGVLNFSLNLDPSYNGPPPTLVLAPGTTGLSLLPYTPPTSTPTPTVPTGGSGGTSPNSTPTASVPEPMSLVLWSAATGLGLLRARAFRRSRLAQQA
jgi:hypothetical protein